MTPAALLKLPLVLLLLPWGIRWPDQRHARRCARPHSFPNGHPQAQFAGYYVAHVKGSYAQRGIDLDIRRGGPDRCPD